MGTTRNAVRDDPKHSSMSTTTEALGMKRKATQISLREAIETFPGMRWRSEEDEAQAARDNIKLRILIACGAAHPTELAAAAEHLDRRQQLHCAVSIARDAREEAKKHPRLADLTRRLVRHNPIGARRVALELIERDRQEQEAVTAGIAVVGRVFGLS